MKNHALGLLHTAPCFIHWDIEMSIQPLLSLTGAPTAHYISTAAGKKLLESWDRPESRRT